MLFNPPKIDNVEADVVRQIDKLRETLAYAVRTPKRWPGLLRRISFARAIRGSNSIEGFKVTVEDALAAIQGEAPIEASELSWKAVTGYRAAMTYVLQLAVDPHFRHSTDLIRSLHFMMLEYDLSKNPGRWRPGPIQVGDEGKGQVFYKAPDAEQVPA